MATVAPPCKNRSAMALPAPLVPPVTRARLPENSRGSIAAMNGSFFLFAHLTEELLRHPFSESLVSHFQTHRVGGFCVLAGNIAKLILAVGGRFVHDLGNLIGRRIC